MGPVIFPRSYVDGVEPSLLFEIKHVYLEIIMSTIFSINIRSCKEVKCFIVLPNSNTFVSYHFRRMGKGYD